MSKEPVITLTTDFGLKDHWVGTMKGVILSINPSATVVDITHQVSPQNVMEASFLLSSAYSFFPEGTIHVAVVDPGVGTSRHPIAVETERYIFVGPDNGIFTEALKGESIKAIVAIEDSSFMLGSVSNTFHGRDIFAPVAAHISRGVGVERLGRRLDAMVELSIASPRTRQDGSVEGEVLYIDGFGNIITNIGEEWLRPYSKDSLAFELGGRTIEGICQSYAEGEGRGLIALVGSTGRVEIALYMGRADEELGINAGERVVMRVKK